MGIRSLICLVYLGLFVVAQFANNHGYPRGQGATLVKCLMVPDNAEHLREGLSNIYHTYKEETDRLDEEGWFSFHDNAGAKILEMVASSCGESRAVIAMALEFATDSLFREYFYAVDLDQDVFECYYDIVPGTGWRRTDSRVWGISLNDLAPLLLTEFSFDAVTCMKCEEGFLEVSRYDGSDEEDEQEENEVEGDEGDEYEERDGVYCAGSW